ncbi:MAG TPA: DUF4326 domain-containing protein [Dongiaceae bacterium]|nr:DUF4326 domain-containing protein [Dongiaceae bacterium]
MAQHAIQAAVSVRAVNLHEDEWSGRGDFVGRPCILGNPYPIACGTGRERVVERYRAEWLWPIVEAGLAGRWAGRPSVRARFQGPPPVKHGWPWGEDDAVRQAVWEGVLGLVARAQAGEAVVLLCYCKPLPCHADVLVNCILWLAGKLDASRVQLLGCA